MNLSWEELNKFKVEDFVPEKRSDLHLWMLKYDPRDRTKLYGSHWADPEISPTLRTVRKFFIDPFVPGKIVLEIGPGGGRWTQYLKRADKLFLIDPFMELLNETRKNFNEPNMEFILNNGTDFPCVPERCVDYIFCFDVFVHLSVDIIKEYLINMRSILSKGGFVFINYADNTKKACLKNKGYAKDNNSEIMHQLINDLRYAIIAENHTAFDSSNTMLIRPFIEGKEIYYHTNEITK